MAPFLWLQVGTAHWQTAPIPLPAKPTQISKLPKLTQVITISCLVNTACSSLWGFSVTFCPIHIIPTLLPSSPSTRPPILTCPSHPTPQFSLIVPLTLESAKCLLPWLPVQFWLPALSPPAFPRCATCAPESHLCWQLPRRWLFHYRLLKNLAPAFGPVIWGGVCFHPSYFKTDLPNFHFNPGKKKNHLRSASLSGELLVHDHLTLTGEFWRWKEKVASWLFMKGAGRIHCVNVVRGAIVSILIYLVPKWNCTLTLSPSFSPGASRVTYFC